MLLSLLEKKSDGPVALILRPVDTTAAGSSQAYLSSDLRFVKDESGQDICLLKTSAGDEIGVMMGWEREIMLESVKALCEDHPNFQQGLKVLNIGFGLGIIDEMFQSLSQPPAHHVIIEPHKDVLSYMRQQGWYDRSNVTILEGKWQDFVETDKVLGFGGFDVVYTDTFSENYNDLRAFFDHVPNLLADSESRFGFFNGLGATNALFYDVYTRLSELHLADLGINVVWRDVDVTSGSRERWGSTREYFKMPLYRLPVGKF